MFRERKNCAKVISNDLLQADQDPIDLEIFIDNLAQEGLIDDNARLKLWKAILK